PKPDTPLHREVVCRVVNRVVTNVAEREAGRDGRRKAAESHGKQHSKEDRQWDAYNRRHNQPGRVVGVVMVNTVDHVMQKFANTGLWLVMKNVSVDDVFEQRPDEHANNE